MASPPFSTVDQASTNGGRVIFRSAPTTQTHQTSITQDHDDASENDLLLAKHTFPVALISTILLLGLSMSVAVLGLSSVLWGWAAALAILITLAFLVLARVMYVIRKGQPAMSGIEADIQSGKKDSAPDLSKYSAVSYLYVLGSGGHTTEMMALIKQSFKPNKNAHRRYIITDGDRHSINQNKSLERLIRLNCLDGTAGTHDTLLVTRARSVHQSFFTSVFTSMQCAFGILAALTMIPAKRMRQPNSADFKYPHVIVTNGPGTGFIVALVAFVLKVVWLAPQDRLKVVFVETWARTHHLGLTGKLFYWSQIAALFVVQNDTLAKGVGKPSIGNVNMRVAQLPRGPVAAS